MSLENTLREMLSESDINPSPNQTPESKQRAFIRSTRHTEKKPNPTPSTDPTRSASGAGVDYNPEGPKPGNPTRRGIKEFYKARLEGALLGESKAHRAAERAAGVPLLGSGPQSHRDAERAAGVKLGPGAPHEKPALWGARREARSNMVDRIAAGILAAGVAAGGFGVGKGVAGSLIRTDVHTHNDEVAAGEVVPPQGVDIEQVRATAEQSPEHRRLQRTAMKHGLKEALLGKIGKRIGLGLVAASCAAGMAGSGGCGKAPEASETGTVEFSGHINGVPYKYEKPASVVRDAEAAAARAIDMKSKAGRGISTPSKPSISSGPARPGRGGVPSGQGGAGIDDF